MSTLKDKACRLSAGGDVDNGAVERWGVDLAYLKKLGEAYRMGWLHNVLSRITPLTMRKRDDYLMMADIFVLDEDAAENILDRFDSDLELFCSMAQIQITEHMTMDSVSEELRCHIDLYTDVANILCEKFALEARDPIAMLTSSTNMLEDENDFILDFVDTHFKRK
jgi:hypothetical protein